MGDKPRPIAEVMRAFLMIASCCAALLLQTAKRARRAGGQAGGRGRRGIGRREGDVQRMGEFATSSTILLRSHFLRLELTATLGGNPGSGQKEGDRKEEQKEVWGPRTSAPHRMGSG